MFNQHEGWCDAIIEVHSCLSKELFRQLKLTENEERRAQLKRLLNEIDNMDSLVDCKEPSLKKYRLACKAFLECLDQLQLASLMLEKIQKECGADHFFLKTILPTLKQGLKEC
ncbi:MAG: hypothetical protein KA508_05165 [Gammaproteobacteria bacterium]|nr:hypothetical protein [Gammaproteobacteria bacterium]